MVLVQVFVICPLPCLFELFLFLARCFVFLVVGVYFIFMVIALAPRLRDLAGHLTPTLPTSPRRFELLRLWDDGDSRQFLGHGDFNRGRAQSASQCISSTLCLFARLCMCIQLRQSFPAFGVVVAVAASLSGLAGHPPTPTARQFSPRRRELLRSFIFPA